MSSDKNNTINHILITIEKFSDIIIPHVIPIDKIDNENYNEHIIQAHVTFQNIFSKMNQFKEILHQIIDTKNEKSIPFPPFKLCYIPSSLKSLFYDPIWSYIPSLYNTLDFIGNLYNKHTILYNTSYDEIEKNKEYYKNYIGYYADYLETIDDTTIDDTTNDHTTNHAKNNDHTTNHVKNNDHTTNHVKNNDHTTNHTYFSKHVPMLSTITSYCYHFKEKIQQFIPMVKPIMRTVVNICNLFL